MAVQKEVANCWCNHVWGPGGSKGREQRALGPASEVEQVCWGTARRLVGPERGGEKERHQT